MSVGEMCTDNRFKLIEKYKNRLIEATNIETDEDEMKVIDNILFRFWQMKWLDALEKQIPKKPLPYKGFDGKCVCCGVVFLDRSTNYCGNCGQALDWSDTE